ncbi:hypothetical protein CDL12_23030 [Handroanthus impetiginosus]|uniref:NAC domain-containing protein n=1 Tax=Handroanthus impetiginosus TaxID=429701 RepID=A0A2G9GGL5_9LAMI|nr:hypothetical protein CDL12_23030 [Handroanthus impetiginosus]
MERPSFNTGDEPIELPPGFRFHPTDEELITYYLSPKVLNSSFCTKAIGEVDLNKVEPWDLPWKAKMGEKEWYFFCIRDRKYPTGLRTNRATEAGYWKATGKDKEIFRAKILVGMKKTLVFYRGRAPRGEKTNWVMHEYRLEGKNSIPNLPKSAKHEWVICRVFKKISGGKKVHISGLVRGKDCGNDLPPLMDFSDENRTMAIASGEGSHVTCFSTPMEDPRDKSADEFSSYSNNKISNPNTMFSSCTGNLHYSDSVWMQDQSLLRHLLEGNGSCTKQNPKPEFFDDIGLNDEGFNPIISSGEQVEYDGLWNY